MDFFRYMINVTGTQAAPRHGAPAAASEATLMGTGGATDLPRDVYSVHGKAIRSATNFTEVLDPTGRPGLR